MTNRKIDSAARVTGVREERSVTIRLSVEVLSFFQAEGADYRTRIRETLEEYVERTNRIRSFERACSKLDRLSSADREELATLLLRPLNA